jgi:hypothetical protein
MDKEDRLKFLKAQLSLGQIEQEDYDLMTE